jgi:hydrogenase nickel incorporation protein HypB
VEVRALRFALEAIAPAPADGDLHFGAGAAKVSVPGMSQARAIQLETDVLGANNRVAAQPTARTSRRTA